jgi:general secretion pathway protein D
LGDLPLIGSLFKYTTRSRSKTNLMVFLRPTLLRSGDRVNSLTNDRYDYIMGEQLKMKPATDALPDFGSPSLPPRQSAPPGVPDKPAIAAPK